MGLYWICKNGLNTIPTSQKEKRGVFRCIYYCHENDFTEDNGQRIYHGLPMDERDGKSGKLRNVNITSIDFFQLTTTEYDRLSKKHNAYKKLASSILQKKAKKASDWETFDKTLANL